MLKVPMFKKFHGSLTNDDRIKIVRSGSNRFLSISVIKNVPEFSVLFFMLEVFQKSISRAFWFKLTSFIAIKKLNKDKLGSYLDRWLNLTQQIDSFLKDTWDLISCEHSRSMRNLHVQKWTNENHSIKPQFTYSQTPYRYRKNKNSLKVPIAMYETIFLSTNDWMIICMIHNSLTSWVTVWHIF